MSKSNLWWAKTLTKRLKKYEQYVEKTRRWIKRDKAELRIVIKGLTKEEHLEYRYKVGDIEQVDYQVIKQEMEDEKK